MFSGNMQDRPTTPWSNCILSAPLKDFRNIPEFRKSSSGPPASGALKTYISEPAARGPEEKAAFA
jgi:hypothetical protein